jgi:hypothetical protein
LVVNLYNSDKKATYVYCKEPAIPQFYVLKDENEKVGIKKNENEIVIEAKYQEVLLVNFTYFIAKQNGKIGVVNFKDEILFPFEFDDVTFSRGKYGSMPQIIGLKKGGKWEYYGNLTSQKSHIIDSNYKCDITTELSLKNAVGIFALNNKKNILFKDGSILPDDYDWISDNGTIGIQGNKVYLIYDKNNRHLYYEAN